LGPDGDIELAKLARAGVVASLALASFALLALPVRLCLVATFLHVPCPGCGLTRAAFAMMRGDFRRAFELHPLSWLVVPLLALIVVGHAVGYVRTGRAWAAAARVSRWSEAAMAIVALLLVAVWIARFCGSFGGPVPV
jgi:hypothetical protein